MVVVVVVVAEEEEEEEEREEERDNGTGTAVNADMDTGQCKTCDLVWSCSNTCNGLDGFGICDKRRCTPSRNVVRL